MKTKMLVFIFVICLMRISFAQTPDWLWAKSTSGPGSDSGYSIAVDGMGNIYTTGHFSATVDFDPGPGIHNLTSVGEYDTFITKLDSGGNFVWSKSIGGPLHEEGKSITVDSAGNVYSTGYFNATVDFDPGAGVYNLTSAGGLDVYIVKLDSGGNFVWSKSFGGADSDFALSIALDPSGVGNIYTTGVFNDTVDFNPDSGVFNLFSSGSYDMFLSKLDASGNFLYAKTIGGISMDHAYSIALDTSGNVYITGLYAATVDFDPDSLGSFILTSAGSFDIFILKMDASGNFVWAKSLGGTGSDWGLAIAIDLGGNIYTTGYFSGGIADFDPGPGVFNLSSVGGIRDIFISKLNTSGNFVWAKSIGSTSDDLGWSLKVDPTNNGYIYTTGAFSDTADFDPGQGVFNLTAIGIYDIFLSKLDSSGNFVWAKSMGSAIYDIGISLDIDDFGYLHMTGSYSNPITFDSIALPHLGHYDIFIAKLDLVPNTLGSYEIENSGKRILLAPNPATNHFTINFPGNDKQIKIVISDITGKVIYSTNSNETKVEVSTEDFADGIYFVKINGVGFIETQKLIVVNYAKAN